MNIKTATGKAVRYYRQKIKLSRRVAAKRAGISEVFWNKFESGERGVSLETLESIAPVIGATMTEVMEKAEFFLQEVTPESIQDDKVVND